MQLVRQSQTRAWLLLQAETDSEILQTSSAGRSWERRSDPCGQTYASTMGLRGTNQLWLVCGSEPGAGEQIKVAYRSIDGASHWRKINAKLSISGYIASLTVMSSSLWLGLVRERPQSSTDNGVTWNPVAINPPDDFAGFGKLHFIRDRIGWVTNYGTIYRTVDGYHWEGVPLSRAFPGAIATL